jgi:hypothetical protein
MAQTRKLSPKAQSMRRGGHLVFGIVLIAGWALVTIPVTLAYSDNPVQRFGMGVALQIFCGLPGLIGVILLISGIVGEVQARRFNAQDWALADALAESLRDLWSHPPEIAYQAVNGEAQIQGARLIEIERHFDAQTNGAITGTMTHQLRMFGTSFSTSYGSASLGYNRASFSSSTGGVFSARIRGLSEVNLDVSSTTRDNLLGDALFAVLEAPGSAGERDTYRVISMSQPGVASWINDLVWYAANQVGGQTTHAGATVLHWANNLIARFVPGDISYVTDRLKAVHTRAIDERDTISVRGLFAGRNAIIATSVTIGGGEELRLMPARFPGLFGHAVATGVVNGERGISAQPRPSLPSS